MPDIDSIEAYEPYLGQANHWPRFELGKTRPDLHLVHEMNPGHAINAYRKLTRLAGGCYPRPHVKRTPLAMALLEQAIGDPVLYTDDQPQVSLEGETHGGLDVHLTELTLEACFDALARVDAIVPTDGKPPHPITRARVLLAELTNTTL